MPTKSKSVIGEINQQLKPTDVGFQAANRHYMVKVIKDGKVIFESKPFYRDWIKDPERLSYEGIVFRPSGICNQMSQYYKNLFTGFNRIKLN